MFVHGCKLQFDWQRKQITQMCKFDRNWSHTAPSQASDATVQKQFPRRLQ